MQTVGGKGPDSWRRSQVAGLRGRGAVHTLERGCGQPQPRVGWADGEQPASSRTAGEVCALTPILPAFSLGCGDHEPVRLYNHPQGSQRDSLKEKLVADIWGG